MSAERASTVPAEEVLEYPQTLSNWGRWGADDRRGTLNLITPAKRIEAAGLVRTGKVISLSRDIDPANPDPLYTGGSVTQRFMTIGEVSHYVGRENTRFDAVTEYVGIAQHGSNTHLDGLAHYSWDGRNYNGLVAADTTDSLGGATALSVRDASDGIISRGVLLDIPALLGVPWLEPGHPITIDELEAAEHREGVHVRSGDVLLIHTGHVARTLEHGVVLANQLPKEPGLHASCLPWLRERDIAVLGSDAIQDVQPSGYADFSLLRPIHAIGLTALGLWLIDMVQLTELAAQCATDQRWEFLFAMLPWRFVGITSAATNPIALF